LKIVKEKSEVYETFSLGIGTGTGIFIVVIFVGAEFGVVGADVEPFANHHSGPEELQFIQQQIYPKKKTQKKTKKKKKKKKIANTKTKNPSTASQQEIVVIAVPLSCTLNVASCL